MEEEKEEKEEDEEAEEEKEVDEKNEVGRGHDVVNGTEETAEEVTSGVNSLNGSQEEDEVPKVSLTSRA